MINQSKNKYLYIILILISLFIILSMVYDYHFRVDNIETIEKKIPVLMKKYNIPGVAVGIIENGEIVSENGYGYSDKSRNLLVDTETIFQVGSISKTLTAWGCMKLVEEGIIDLDQPVNNYLSRWKIQSQEYDGNKVTTRMLLSHTAGLSLHGYSGFMPSGTLPSLEESLNGNTNGCGSVYLIEQPGSKYIYSGGGYTVLQLLIEETTQCTFSEYMRNEIFIPLNMKSSTFESDEISSNNRAVAYNWWGNELPNYRFTAKAAAGLFTNLEDMLTFLNININKPIAEKEGVLSQKTIETMFHSVPVTNGVYGLGYKTKELNNETKIIMHSGMNEGWKAQFIIVPNQNSGIVICTNSDRGMDFINDIVSLWFSKIMHQNKGAYNFPIERYIVTIIALLISFFSLKHLIKLISKIRKSKMEFTSKVKFFTMIKIIIIIGFDFLWVFGLYTGIVFAKYLPSTFKLLTLSVFLFSIVVLFSFFVEKKA